MRLEAGLGAGTACPDAGVVADVMDPAPSTCGPHRTMSAVAQMLWFEHRGCVPVVRDDCAGELLGLLTDADVRRALRTYCRPLDSIRASEAMSPATARCRPDTSVTQALANLADEGTAWVAVLDASDRLVGIVSRARLAAAADADAGARSHAA